MLGTGVGFLGSGRTSMGECRYKYMRPWVLSSTLQRRKGGNKHLWHCDTKGLEKERGVGERRKLSWAGTTAEVADVDHSTGMHQALCPSIARK